MKRLSELILDLLLALALLFVTPWYAARLAQPDSINIVIIGGTYLALVIGTLMLRHVEPPEISKPLFGWTAQESLGCAAFLSLGYSVFIIAIMFVCGGMLAIDQPFVELLEYWGRQDQALAYVLYVGLVLFVLALPVALYYQPKRRLAYNSVGGTALRIIGLLGVNCTILMTAAWWSGYFAGASADGYSVAVKSGITLVMAGLFLIFWAPPRLIAIVWSADRWAIASFIVVVIIAAARVVW